MSNEILKNQFLDRATSFFKKKLKIIIFILIILFIFLLSFLFYKNTQKQNNIKTK